MKIDWAASAPSSASVLVSPSVFVGLFTLGIVALARQELEASGTARSGPWPRAPRYACFALCAARGRTDYI